LAPTAWAGSLPTAPTSLVVSQVVCAGDLDGVPGDELVQVDSRLGDSGY
jgi:hypothetical protein